MKAKDIITESHQACPHCGGPLVEYSGLMEKKDACYYKVKASAKVWPSAYASGRLVQCRKKGAGSYGNKSESVTEGEGNLEQALATLTGSYSGWYKENEFSTPDLDYYSYDDGHGGHYSDGTIEHNLKTGEVTVEYSGDDEYEDEVKGTFKNMGDALRALRGDGGSHGGRAPNFDQLGQRTPHGPDDLRKTDRTGRKGTIGGGYANKLKGSINYNKGKLGPKGVLPEQGVSEGVAETVEMYQAMKVLRHYGADHFKTTSNELHFYKNGRPMSVDLIFNDDATRSVSLSQLNSMIRGLKGQGLPAADTTIKVDGIPVKITRAGKNDSYIGYSWTTEDGKEHYEETSVNDHSNLRSLANAISDEIEQSQKQGVAEAQLDEKCWDGYQQQGMKNKSGRQVPNCVPTKSVAEAANPAQQAAIAIAKKKKQGVSEDADRTQATRRIQKMLNTKYHANLDIDGVLGPLTLASINKFMPDSDSALADDPGRTSAVQGSQDKDVSEDDQIDTEIEEMYEAMDQLAEEIAAKQGVSVDLVWESFEALDDHMLFETAAWRRSAGKSKKGGLNAKGVASYRRENPGSKLQMAVTTKPSKLKPGSKAAKRRKSFCARMGGVKGPMKKPNGKPTRKALALRKWNC